MAACGCRPRFVERKNPAPALPGRGQGSLSWKERSLLQSHQLQRLCCDEADAKRCSWFPASCYLAHTPCAGSECDLRPVWMSATERGNIRGNFRRRYPVPVGTISFVDVQAHLNGAARRGIEASLFTADASCVRRAGSRRASGMGIFLPRISREPARKQKASAASSSLYESLARFCLVAHPLCVIIQ